MKDLGRRSGISLLFALLPFAAAGKDPSLAKGSPSQPSPASKSQPDRGQQVFEQNCSRCHNAPEGFSPRIAGAIARHMRVRAELSDDDYKALRRFLAP